MLIALWRLRGRSVGVGKVVDDIGFCLSFLWIGSQALALMRNGVHDWSLCI